MVDCMCVLVLGDGVKRRPRRTIRKRVGLKWDTGETWEANSAKAYITNDGHSLMNSLFMLE
jgi:hypothetical protein